MFCDDIVVMAGLMSNCPSTSNQHGQTSEGNGQGRRQTNGGVGIIPLLILVLVVAATATAQAGKLLLDAGRGGLDVDVVQVGASAGGEFGQKRRIEIELGDGPLDASEVDPGFVDARSEGIGDGGGILPADDDRAQEGREEEKDLHDYY